MDENTNKYLGYTRLYEYSRLRYKTRYILTIQMQQTMNTPPTIDRGVKINLIPNYHHFQNVLPFITC